MITATSRQENYMTAFTDGAHEGIADTTRDKGGADSGFRPHDLLEAALACCINMWLKMYAENHDIPLAGVEVKAELDRSVPGTATFRYSIDLKGDLTEGDRKKLLAVAKSCPVHKTLSGNISFEAAGG